MDGTRYGGSGTFGLKVEREALSSMPWVFCWVWWEKEKPTVSIKKWNKHLKLFVQLMSVQMNINKPWINIERFLFLGFRSVCLRSSQTVAFLGRQQSRTVNIAAFAFMNRAACCKFRLVPSRHLTVILGNMNGWYGWIPVKVLLMSHSLYFFIFGKTHCYGRSEEVTPLCW